MQICGAGINLGIDFTGGSLLTYSVGENYDSDDVAIILQEAGYTDYQITKTEPYRPEKFFADAVKGLDVFGAKIVRQNEIYVVKAHG